MQTEKEVNSKILKITMSIQEKYPELSKYLLEMPMTIPDVTNPEINIKVLNDYVNSLEVFYKRYIFITIR
jgi:hypothetical protein